MLLSTRAPWSRSLLHTQRSTWTGSDPQELLSTIPESARRRGAGAALHWGEAGCPRNGAEPAWPKTLGKTATEEWNCVLSQESRTSRRTEPSKKLDKSKDDRNSREAVVGGAEERSQSSDHPVALEKAQSKTFKAVGRDWSPVFQWRR